MYDHFARFPSDESLKYTSSFQFHFVVVLLSGFPIFDVKSFTDQDIFQVFFERLHHSAHVLHSVLVTPAAVT